MAGNGDRQVSLNPHKVLGADCCGCLMAQVRGAEADIVCNECGVVIRTMPVPEVESAMAALAATSAICSARCAHCRAVNTFPRLDLDDGVRMLRVWSGRDGR
jgi:hypothetical protein